MADITITAPIPPAGSVTGIAVGDAGATGVMTDDRFVLICASGFELTSVQNYRTGTVQLTLKPKG